MSYAPIPKEEIELFKQLPDLNVIFDVGARDDTDYYDIYPNAQHHLFEPNQEFVANLREKVGDKPNVFINAVGVGDIEGTMRYSKTSQAFEGGEIPLGALDDSYPVIRLDKYIEEHKIDRIDFLKIDVEGYDYKVLLGGEKAIDMTRFIQYEHSIEKNAYYSLLGSRFDMEYVGYRNVLCMHRGNVDVRTRNKIREYIADHEMHKLH